MRVVWRPGAEWECANRPLASEGIELPQRRVNAKGKYSTSFRFKVWLKTLGRCFYCGRELNLAVANRYDSFTIDRIIPGAEGGRYTLDNSVPACRSCNGYKDDLSFQTFLFIAGRPWSHRKALPRRGTVAQRIEQELSKLKVLGSSPSGPATYFAAKRSPPHQNRKRVSE